MAEAAKPGRGDFFAVDRRAWGSVLALGLNAAVAYLVMATGTGGDQKTTCWSVQAIEKYTAISRPRARIALDSLIAAKLVTVVKPGNRPRYELTRPPLETGAESPLIWMPNVLIGGVPGNLCPPLELVRQTQSIDAIKLLVELYAAHDLMHGAGVDWRALRKQYSRKKVREMQQFSIWCFTEITTTAWPSKAPAAAFMTGKYETTDGKKSDSGWPVFWDAIRVLSRISLLEFVPHIVESDSDDAEIFAPMGFGAGTDPERALAASATAAARRMMGADFYDGVENKMEGFTVPLPGHLANAQMVGIARLRYRPKTTATAAWLARADEWMKLAEFYEGTANPVRAAVAA